MDKYLQYADYEKPIPPHLKAIEFVNSHVTINQVLRDLCDIYVPREVHSWRIHCPWGKDHSDKGVGKHMKVYWDSNTAHCFAGHGFFTPVKLWAAMKGTTQTKAAKQMAKEYAIGRTADYYDRMVDMVMSLDEEEPFDVATIIQSVLPLHPAYIKNQFLPEVREYVVAWTQAEFPMDEEEFREEFEKWKMTFWRMLDSKSKT